MWAVTRSVYQAPLRQMLWTMLAGFSVCFLLALAPGGPVVPRFRGAA